MKYLVAAALVLFGCAACAGGGGASAASPSAGATAGTSNSGTSLQSAYQQAQWQTPAVTVSFSGSCSMTLQTTGAPPVHNSYYLAPAGNGQTVVAYTAVSHTALALIAYNGSNLDATTETFNICPTKAATTTATGGGPIGWTISGEVLFDAYEMDGTTAALSDNASYAVPGTNQTAYFIDQCNSHSAGTMNGTALWHYHGVPSCLTGQVDGNGPSHIIGIALDGFPIYGGRDVNGNVISASGLDACNGLTSPTPEFPNGIYHYVLPIGVTGSRSSLNCFSGTVSAQVAALVRSPYLCGLEALTPARRAAVLAQLRRQLLRSS